VDLAKRLASHYRSLFGDRLIGLVLYGSRARGDARPDSDLDVMLIANGLPDAAVERARLTRPPALAASDPDVSVRALTPAEYERDIAPIDLDIAVDGLIILDPTGYLGERLALIRQRIDEAGLYRDQDLVWRWRRWPARRDWRVTWQGVSL
jgi:hypothetical protein